MKYRVREAVPSDIEKEFEEYSDIVRKLLYYRGITTKKEAEAFLNPDYEKQTHSFSLLFGVKEAVERIEKAIEKEEVIAIYSDYDADGVPGSVILSDFFEKIGYKNIVLYIPHRNDEGFGLNKEALAELSSKSVSLVITIDCGIADVVEVAYAKELGMEVIITDHHLPGEELPDATAIVNPKHASCRYPDDLLCGSGVIFKLVQALVATKKWDIPEGWDKWLLDMVGIATLSDMVPLRGENRVLAYYGLLVLRKTRRLGLKCLLQKNRINQYTLTEEDVGFTISPRINAASRMGHPMDAFNMLSAKNSADAETSVLHLERINRERKKTVALMVREAHKHLSAREVGSVIVIGNPHWKPSLAGLLANKLATEYGRPAFVWGRGGEKIKGSCRTGNGSNIFELMSRVRPGIFSGFGGHAQSGGFVLTDEGVHSFEEALCEAYEEPEETTSYFADAYLDPDMVTAELYNQISKLSPFGQGNPKPLFMFENVRIDAVKYFGKSGEHTELHITRKERPLKAIAFFKNNFSVQAGSTCTLLAEVEKNTFGRYPEIRLRIVDVV
ncbi:MAG: single-stranded-DNA-specific exonuclease RecJ [Candidatus Paceibacterota bacterium]